MSAQAETVDRLLTVPDVIGDRERGIQGFVPMSRAKFYQLLKDGKFPKPVKIGKNTYWKMSTIQQVIEGVGKVGEAAVKVQ